jgi:hypothetical protein
VRFFNQLANNIIKHTHKKSHLPTTFCNSFKLVESFKNVNQNLINIMTKNIKILVEILVKFIDMDLNKFPFF